jgi:hypothetical protein
VNALSDRRLAARAVYAARDEALRIARAPLNFHHILGRKLVTWGFEVRARRKFAATLSPAERRQFRAYCRVNPSWRGFMALKHAERDHRTSSPASTKVIN